MQFAIRSGPAGRVQRWNPKLRCPSTNLLPSAQYCGPPTTRELAASRVDQVKTAAHAAEAWSRSFSRVREDG
jgi:hypothetical protein